MRHSQIAVSVAAALIASTSVFAQSAPQSPAARPTTAPAAPAAAPPAPAGVAAPADYIIGPDDQLSVLFWRDKDMSSDVTVRPDGKITLPLLNEVQAAGLTPDQLR